MEASRDPAGSKTRSIIQVGESQVNRSVQTSSWPWLRPDNAHMNRESRSKGPPQPELRQPLFARRDFKMTIGGKGEKALQEFLALQDHAGGVNLPPAQLPISPAALHGTPAFLCQHSVVFVTIRVLGVGRLVAASTQGGFGRRHLCEHEAGASQNHRRELHASSRIHTRPLHRNRMRAFVV